jgi:hypothetical protein
MIVPVLAVAVIIGETAPIEDTVATTVPVVGPVTALKITLTRGVISAEPMVLITFTIMAFVAVFKLTIPRVVLTSIGTTTPCFGFHSHCGHKK